MRYLSIVRLMGGLVIESHLNKDNMKTLNAMKRYEMAKNDINAINMTEPFETTTELYVWSVDTLNPFDEGEITSSRYYAEDINGGNTMRISLEDYIFFFEKCRVKK